jgi:uncharacterized protein YecE (DUF72 family)
MRVNSNACSKDRKGATVFIDWRVCDAPAHNPAAAGSRVQISSPQPILSCTFAVALCRNGTFSTEMSEGVDRSRGGRILVGTASWSDPGFVERWYPKRMPAGERLAWYAQHFEMVEVNSTFYSTPEPRLIERWRATTPEHFTFDVKLHKLLSRHSADAKLLPPQLQRRAAVDRNGKIKLTPDLEEALIELFLRSMSILRKGNKLGVLLLQLSPAFSPHGHHLGELERLIAMLRDHALAIEFRNRNWVVGPQLRSTIDFLKRHNVIFVNVDAPAAAHFTIMPSDVNEITNPQATYLRLHGRNPEAYLKGKTVATRFNYDYNEDEIAEIADRTQKLAGEAREVHAVFNNNNLDYAPRAATRLRAALGQVTTPPPPQTPELF